MYQDCHLVHADLSEFNLLYHKGTVYMIDVSQSGIFFDSVLCVYFSVEHDHPRAVEFLQNDITHVLDFFRKKNVNVMSSNELFQYITGETLEKMLVSAISYSLSIKLFFTLVFLNLKSLNLILKNCSN